MEDDLMMNKSYSELISLKTFEERFRYLELNASIGQQTFGYDRYLNQCFYRSKDWLTIRRDIIIRDNGCDLACEGYEIFGRILIHHLNPISINDIVYRNSILLDPENLVVVSFDTHNAIHYGDESSLPSTPVERKPFDTCPWR
jgi:hypothetical protein